jgi:hypothetical protein
MPPPPKKVAYKTPTKPILRGLLHRAAPPELLDTAVKLLFEKFCVAKEAPWLAGGGEVPRPPRRELLYPSLPPAPAPGPLPPAPCPRPPAPFGSQPAEPPRVAKKYAVVLIGSPSGTAADAYGVLVSFSNLR